MKITEKDFYDATGKLPFQDDLERCNCDEAGKLGHEDCGWCFKCNRPVFMCGHKKEI